MRKLVCVGIVALAAAGASFVATPVMAQESELRQASPDGVVVTESQIAQMKSALKLRTSQERHWGPVASALRELSRKQTRNDSEQTGTVRRMTDRAATAAVAAATYQRLASAAAPLIRSLDEEQKRGAVMVARAMGFGHLASSF